MGQKRKRSAEINKNRYRNAELPKLYVMNKNNEEIIESTTAIKINNHWKTVKQLREKINRPPTWATLKELWQSLAVLQN